MPLAWTDDLDTGIDVIDFQHRRIVDYLNALEVSLAAGSRPGIGRVLEELVGYTESHFAFEESLQVAADYKLAAAHKAVHDQFVRRLARYRERHLAGDNVGENLYDMLTTWLLHHIKRDDAAYVAEVRAKLIDKLDDQTPGGWLSSHLARFFKQQ